MYFAVTYLISELIIQWDFWGDGAWIRVTRLM